MSNEPTNSSPAVDQSDLIPPLRRMFESDDVSIIEWDQQAPSGTAGTGGGAVSRLAGTAAVGDQIRPWSLIRKWLAPGQGPDLGFPEDTETLSSTRYWKRDFCFYQLDLLDALPAGLAAPICYHAEEKQDEITLWLEEVQDEMPVWPLDRFGIAARHLGLLNGLCLTERPIPDYPWLTVGIPQQREAGIGQIFDNLDELRQHSIVRRGWPDDVAEGILRIWQERQQFLRVLEQLPPVLQHGDAGRKNLMARSGKKGAPETVAIDWGWVGVGAIGEEIAPTVVSTVLWFGEVTPAQLPELEEIVFDGYMQGLREAGWRGDTQLARLGYLCTVALRFGPLIAVPEVMALKPEHREGMKQMFGWSVEEWADILVPIRRFVIQRADEARAIMDAS